MPTGFFASNVGIAFEKNVAKGKTEKKRRRGRRCKKLLDDLKENRRYSNLKEAALAPSL